MPQTMGLTDYVFEDVSDMKILTFCLLAMLNSCAVSSAQLPKLDTGAGLEARGKCLNAMQTEYISWYSSVKINNIKTIEQLAVTLKAGLSESYKKNLHKLNVSTRDLHQKSDFDSYTYALNEAFEQSALSRHPDCASGASEMFGVAVYQGLISENSGLSNDFKNIGADQIYYIKQLVPVLAEVSDDSTKNLRKLARKYLAHVRSLNEAVPKG